MQLGKFHVAGCRVNCADADVTADNLNVQIMLNLPHFIHLAQILIKLLFVVDGPVLKWELSLKTTNGLVERTHQGLNQETA